MEEILFSLMGLSSLLAPPPEATLLFAGDAMQHIAQVNAANRGNGVHDYSECFAEVADYVSSVDFAVVNFETTLGGKPYAGYPCFSSPDSYADALKDAGFDLFLNANNHTLDRNDRGLKRTVNVLNEKGIPHIGTYENQAQRDSVLPYIVDIKGYKISFLNYTYGTNGICPQRDVVVDYIDTALIKNDMASARAAGAELVTVAIHWGDEYRLLPNKEQKRLADFLCDAGADLIIGGHPHVIQPMEIRRNEKYDKNTLVVYSLGNFISDMKKTDTRGGALVRVALARDYDGKAYLKAADYSLVFTLKPTSDCPNYRVVPVESGSVSSMSYQCDMFVKNAESIFNEHNKNVPRREAKAH